MDNFYILISSIPDDELMCFDVSNPLLLPPVCLLFFTSVLLRIYSLFQRLVPGSLAGSKKSYPCVLRLSGRYAYECRSCTKRGRLWRQFAKTPTVFFLFVFSSFL